MPIIRVNGAALYYEEHGTGPETIVFAHGLLWSCRMYDAQVALLKERYRCVTFDFRGQGQSEVTRSGYDMETLYEDAVALINQLGCAPCHFLGLSMGGFIGLRLAARHPELMRSLILLDTSADPEPGENVAKYRQLTFVARWFGLGLVVDRVMPVMFGRTFLTDPVRAQERHEWRGRMRGNHRLGVTRATTGVITRQGVYDEIDKIRVPTLILVGDEDDHQLSWHSRWKSIRKIMNERIHKEARPALESLLSGLNREQLQSLLMQLYNHNPNSIGSSRPVTPVFCY